MKIFLRLLLVSLAIGWAALIYHMSNTPGLEALPFLQRFPFIPEIKDPQLAGDVEYVLRKAAHIMEYAILFILVFLVQRLIIFRKSKKRLAKALLVSLILCIAFAISDEIHQSMVPTRDGRLTDIFIDGFGLMLGQVIVLAAGEVLWGKETVDGGKSRG